MRHGRGKLYRNKNLIYSGHWREDKFDGEGKLNNINLGNGWKWIEGRFENGSAKAGKIGMNDGIVQ